MVKLELYNQQYYVALIQDHHSTHTVLDGWIEGA